MDGGGTGPLIRTVEQKGGGPNKWMIHSQRRGCKEAKQVVFNSMGFSTCADKNCAKAHTCEKCSMTLPPDHL